MTGPGWLALAAAIACSTVPARAVSRLGGLVGAGRLGAVAVGRDVVPARRVDRRWVPALLLALASVAAGLGGGVLMAVAAGAACATGWLVYRDARRRSTTVARRVQLRSALRLLIGELEAGARPAAALAAAAEAGVAYARAFRAAAAAATGAGEAGAVLAAEVDLRPIGLAWRLGEDAGLELAGVLGRVGLDLAAEEEQRRSVAVALAGPRASAALLAGLPLLGFALGAAMGARPWAVLLGLPPGRAVCCAGVLLDAAGVLWMRHILRRAQRP
jgi:tight adherence protein B